MQACILLVCCYSSLCAVNDGEGLSTVLLNGTESFAIFIENQALFAPIGKYTPALLHYSARCAIRGILPPMYER